MNAIVCGCTRFSSTGASGLRRLARRGEQPTRDRGRLEGGAARVIPGELGIELVEIDDDGVTGRLLVDHGHLHPGGYVHGGVWVAFADTVAAWGTMAQPPAGKDLHDRRAEGERPHLRGRRRRAHRARRAASPRSADPGLGGQGHKADRLAANFVCTQMVLPAS
jgi:acyl-coenzyme A thioesterase PaaI-like protein